MSTIYSIALKLSLEDVNQLKDSFSIATQEIRKAYIRYLQDLSGK